MEFDDPNRLSRKEWFKRFNDICVKEVHVDLDDLPDSDYPTNYYQDGLTPEEAWEAYKEDFLSEEGYTL